MNTSEIASILEEIGASFVKIRSDKVLCGCVVHSDDSPSAVVIPGRFGGATYHCSGCGFNSPLNGLIWHVCKMRGRDPRRALSIYFDSVEEDARLSKRPSMYDFVPFADEPVRRRDAEMFRDSVQSVAWTQFDLIAKAERAAPVSTFTESDLNRYKVKISDYMLERGFDRDTQTAWEMRAAPWQHRVVFPIRDWSGVARGMTRRLTWEQDHCYSCGASLLKPGSTTKKVYACKCGVPYAKYLHSKGFDRNEILYGEWLYVDGAIPVIVEGTTDAMRLWQLGIRPPLAHPFAVLGACPGRTQIERLLSHTRGPIVIVRDADPPTHEHPDGPGAQTWQHTIAHLRSLRSDRMVHEVVPGGKDAGVMTSGEADRLVTLLKDPAIFGGFSLFGNLADEIPTWYTTRVRIADARSWTGH